MMMGAPSKWAMERAKGVRAAIAMYGDDRADECIAIAVDAAHAEGEAEAEGQRAALDELRKIAAVVGEEDDPFAAWESLEAMFRERDTLRAELIDQRRKWQACTAAIEYAATADVDATDFLRGWMEGEEEAFNALAEWLADDREHAADCAVNNGPAEPPGPCDCGGPQ